MELREGIRRVGGDALSSAVALLSPLSLAALSVGRLRVRVLLLTEWAGPLLALLDVLLRSVAEKQEAVWAAVEALPLDHVLQLRGHRHAVCRPVQVQR